MSEETIPHEEIWTVPVDEEVYDEKPIPRVKFGSALAVVKAEADNLEIILKGEPVVNLSLSGDGIVDNLEVVTKNERPSAKIDSAKMRIFNIAFVGKDREIVLDNVSGDTSLSLRLEFVYHDFESHFRIHARFDRQPEDVDHISGQYHRAYINLPREAFGDVTQGCSISIVQDESEIPSLLRTNASVQKLFPKYFVNKIEFDVAFFREVNLRNSFNAKSSADMEALQKLREFDKDPGKFVLLVRGGDREREAFKNFATHLSTEGTPLALYYHKNGTYQAQWGQRKPQEETFSHAVAAQTTFANQPQWYISNVYGVIRDQEYAVECAKSISSSTRPAFLIRVPGTLLPNGLPRQYVAFVDLNDSELSSQVLTTGSRVEVAWYDPDENIDANDDSSTNVPKCLWKGLVVPSMLGREMPGDLALMISRPAIDDRQLVTNVILSDSMIPTTDFLRIFPGDSEKPGKRLVSAVNLIHEGQTAKDRLIKKVLFATNFSDIVYGSSLRQSEVYQTRRTDVEQLSSNLSAAQRKVWDIIFDSKNIIEFVTGPFGTGKTTFITLLTRALAMLGQKILLCCSSNAALDALAEKIQIADPQLRAVRFHSMSMEESAIGRESRSMRKAVAAANKGSEETPDNNPDVAEPSEFGVDPAQVQESEDLVRLSVFLAKQLRAKRVNFNTMSLMTRCLELAGITASAGGIPEEEVGQYSHFRDLFQTGDDTDDEFAKKFKNAMETVQAGVFRRTSVVLTTFSNSGDKFLKNHFSPTWIIGDEVGATQDAEFLIPVAANMDSLERILGVGDAQQLPPVIVSHKRKSDQDTVINEFSNILTQPLIHRVQQAGLKISMLVECFRCTAGLEQPSSAFFYDNKVINGPATDLASRPRSQATVEYIRQHYHVETTIPRLVFDLSNGVCLKAPNGSRFNSYNVAHTMTLLLSLIRARVFQPNEIAVETPYRAQNVLYREAFAKASRMPDWAGLDVWQIRIMTVDGFRGGERPCTIFDMVTATRRKGRIGFLQDYRRLNVAITRCQDALFLVGDLQAITNEQPDDKTGEENEIEIPEDVMVEMNAGLNHLRKLCHFYTQSGCVIGIDINSLDETYVSFTDAENFALQYAEQDKCRRCGNPGHQAKDCRSAERTRSISCKLCGEETHRARECPEQECHNCFRKGHTRADCTSERVIKCYHCKEEGHMKGACPELRKPRKILKDTIVVPI